MRARGDPGARQGVSRVRVLANGCRAVLAAAVILLAPWLGARAEEAKSATAQVASGKKVSIEYTLVLDDGTKADSNVGGEPLVYEQGANQILPALETALAGLSVNDTKKVTITPKDGYGDVDPKAVKEVPIEEIPEAARKVDAVLIGVDAEGNQRPVRVQKIGDKTAMLDLNHPLAGRTLTFDVKVLKIE
jgi:FKBP-type peptidyl-prolyl cis-trans isomerase SlyD